MGFGSGWGAEVKLSADGSQSGVPVQGGVKGGVDVGNQIIMTFQTSPDFVIAYQLIRIRSKRGGAFAVRDYNRHALLNDEDGLPGEEEQPVRDVWDIEDVKEPVDGLHGSVMTPEARGGGHEDYDVIPLV